MLQECFKHPNHVRGVCCRSPSNTPVTSVCCRSPSNTTIKSGVQIAGVLQTPQSCQCMLAGVLQTHPNNIWGAYCTSASNIPIMYIVAGVLQTHPNNIRGAYCTSASNIPIMYVCCRKSSKTPIMSVYVAGVLQTPQYCPCMLRECFWSSKNILGYARITPPH